MLRKQKALLRLYPLACGAVTLGLFQALSAMNFSSIWTDVIATFLSLLVTLLFGGASSLTA